MKIIVEGYDTKEAIELTHMAEESCEKITSADVELSIEDGNLFIRRKVDINA